MNTSAEASTFTNTLLSTVRLQRHLGVRIIISTQEPTISPALLDLSSVTIVHRFTSPEWLHSLKSHLAGVASDLVDSEEGDWDTVRTKGRPTIAGKVFREVVKLRVGEALLFAPAAVIEGGPALQGLGAGFVKIRIRARLTTDGGTSVMAT
jgi:hypothetical protein